MYANMICDRALGVSCRDVAPINRSRPRDWLVEVLLTCTLENCVCGMVLHILGIVGYCGANLFTARGGVMGTHVLVWLTNRVRLFTEWESGASMGV